jgi:Uma2 family endonuclease
MSTVAETLAIPPVGDAPSPLGPRDAGTPMTLDEFDNADFEPGYRYELINGVLVVTPPPLEQERDSNEDLGRWLRNYQDDHPQGAALDLTLPEHNIRTETQNRRADRAIWTGRGRLPVTRGPVENRGKPTILVEFPSARPADQRRDYELKQAEYRDFGILEYWIIDRFSRTMAVYSQHDGKWTPRFIQESETYQTPLLPGFTLELKRLLAVSDKYKS